MAKELKEKKVKKDKKKVVKKEQNSNPTNKIPTFSDPTKTIWGKIVVWILIFGMGALIIAALIVAIVTNV